LAISPVLTPPAVVEHRAISAAQAAQWPAFSTARALFRLALLTPAVLLVHGYHPFADDAGIYIAGVRKLADPTLYRPDAAFVLANTHFSVFAHLLAAAIRTTRIPLDVLLFAAHLLSIFAFLLACLTLARRIFAAAAVQWTAVVLAAACFTLPVAGTALLVMDPYVTSRSFSTPLGLFALAAAIDRQPARAALLLLLTALMHPLMAIYVTAFILLFVLVDSGRSRLAIVLSALGFVTAAGLDLAALHLPASAAYRQAILMPMHSYLFPSRWTWYEDLGLAAPLVLFALAAWRLRSRTLAGKLSIAAVLLGSSSVLAAFFFIHPAGPYLLARLQPLRSFHMLYVVGILLLGGLIGNLAFNRMPDAILQPQRRRAAFASIFALTVAIALSMFLAQRAGYASSAHVEWPGASPRNPWQQTFLWIRAHTPADAVFAANPGLVSLDGEDAQGFRATTGRSLLAEDKDAGVVVVFPWLAASWAAERNPQAGLDQLSDPERLARLRPLGATWLLLSSSAVTALPCPYRNAVSQVCQLGAAQK
jgi:hypothetical protein